MILTGATRPGGSDTQIQFNNTGVLGGSADFTFSGSHAAIGPGSSVNQSEFGTYSNVLTLYESVSSLSANVRDNRLYALTNWSSAGAAGAGSFLSGVRSSMLVDSGISAALPNCASIDVLIQHNGTGGSSTYLAGTQNSLFFEGASGTLPSVTGTYNLIENDAGQSITSMSGYWSGLFQYGTGAVTSGYGYYADSPVRGGAGAFDAYFAFYSADAASTITNPYYFWADSRGVYRIREDNVADGSGNPQAIPALYNPRFTKYTAGAADYERGVQQWVGNVFKIGTEAGGTGTLRGVQIIGASLALTGPVTLTEAVGSSGFTITGATQTASLPALNITQTWNNAAVTFTGVRINITNTASASASKYFDVSIGGSSALWVTNAAGGAAHCNYLVVGVQLGIDSNATTSNIYFGTAGDVRLARDASGVLAQRSSTTAQTFRLYNTYTDASNYERFGLTWASNIIRLGAANAGTGTARVMALDYGGTTTAAISIPITSGQVTFGGGITTPGGTLHTTNTALTDGAGASAGTLTNAPAVGNPTKWIPINDNGTTRYIPAW